MKRRTVHTGFAVLTLICAGLSGLYGVQLTRAQALDTALKSVDPAGADDVPLVQLAAANALAAAGELEAASERYTGLVRDHGDRPAGRAALFNLANAYLRAAIAAGVDSQRGRPLMELAKQRYRDLLRLTPDSQDARFNLQRALQLAPETTLQSGERAPPVKRVNVITPDFEPRDLP